MGDNTKWSRGIDLAICSSHLSSVSSFSESRLSLSSGEPPANDLKLALFLKLVFTNFKCYIELLIIGGFISNLESFISSLTSSISII